jgi:hypothetical protein
MIWSADIDTIIENGYNIQRTYKLEVRNGYQASAGGVWTKLNIKNNGWSLSVIDGNPVIGTARFAIGAEDFRYFDEFDHSNAVQLMTELKLTCTVTNTISGGAETNIIYRGILKTSQLVNMDLLIW